MHRRNRPPPFHPRLGIIGGADALILPENDQIIADGIPDADLRVIEGAGHLFWISHPEETVAAVVGFLFTNKTAEGR